MPSFMSQNLFYVCKSTGSIDISCLFITKLSSIGNTQYSIANVERSTDRGDSHPRLHESSMSAEMAEFAVFYLTKDTSGPWGYSEQGCTYASPHDSYQYGTGTPYNPMLPAVGLLRSSKTCSLRWLELLRLECAEKALLLNCEPSPLGTAAAFEELPK